MSADSLPHQRTCAVIEAKPLLEEYARWLGANGKTDAAMKVWDVLTHYPRPKDFTEPERSFARFSVPE